MSSASSNAATNQSSVEVLGVFAEADRDHWKRLEAELDGLRRDGFISQWHSNVISGDVSAAPLELHRVSLLIILASESLQATGYLTSDDIQKAVTLQQQERLMVIPILPQPLDLSDTPLAGLPALPTRARPIDRWPEESEAYADIRRGVQEVLDRMHTEVVLETAPITEEERAATGEPSRGKPSETGIHQPASKPRSPTPASGSSAKADVPTKIGRYHIDGVLGQGAFGRVFRAHDEELDRRVAIKAPHAHRVSKPADMETYLSEAKLVAKLDHPRLVPVYDVGHTNDGLCYVVSKLIDGEDLEKVLKDRRLSFIESAQMIAEIADALNYAHERDLVHRDIKPANILIDHEGSAYVADFGLAIGEEDFGKGARFAGTPAYMSPEQARGEGHRVDGRSDIFSLGIVLYELITGRRPFRSRNLNDLLQEISTTEARPPRQVDANVPRELERICLKAIANRLTDRYTTAGDFRDDLRYFVEEFGDDEFCLAYPAEPISSSTASSGTVDRSGPTSRSTRRSSRRSRGSSRGARTTRGRHTDSTTDHPSSTAAIEPPPPKVVPKGLRAFDAQDSDFFLELVPGPKDRSGLPDSIRQWKTQIECKSPDQTFPVGLLYGPSGCGKSSLLQAGLLPRIDASIVAISLNSSMESTEDDLLREIRSHCPRLPEDLDLPGCLTRIRRGDGLAAGKKLLIVLDQFEQWLHQHYETGQEKSAETLVDALRQCDGGRVQTILLARVDYMMGIHRFMRQLEVTIQEGRNASAVDLFDLQHTANVLVHFGRAFQCLPEQADEMTEQQQAFVQHAVNELGTNGKVIPVQLAVFCEMMKGRRWELETLQQLGGVGGIGLTFLEETFDSQSAPLQHRLHQEAARAVLKDLLPDSGTNIRSRKRNLDQLKAASGYADRPDDFKTLLHLLDQDLRLITPTDKDPDEDAAGERVFELTHDYLVPSLRDWLSRKQRESARGRAQLRLEEQAALYASRPNRRLLPSLPEFVNVLALTRRDRWSPTQRRMMRHATRYHTGRLAIVAGVCLLLVLGGQSIRSRVLADRRQDAAAAMVSRIRDAKLTQLPRIESIPVRELALPNLRKLISDDSTTDPQKLNMQVALLRNASGQEYVDDVLSHLIEAADPAELPVLRDALKQQEPDLDPLQQKLWDATLDPTGSTPEQRLRAAAALADFDAQDQQWRQQPLQKDLASYLASVSPVSVSTWAENLRPIGTHLVGELAEIYRNSSRTDTQRTTAAVLLLAFRENTPESWVPLLEDVAGADHFALFFTPLNQHGANAIALIDRRLKQRLEEIRQRAEEFDELEQVTRKLSTQIDRLNREINDATIGTTAETTASQSGDRQASDSADGDDSKQDAKQRREDLTATKQRVDRLTQDLRRHVRVMQNNQATRDQLASQAANLAIALIRMGEGKQVWPLMAHTHDNRLQSLIMDRLGPYAVPLADLVEQYKSLSDRPNAQSNSIRFALLLAMDQYDRRQYETVAFRQKHPDFLKDLKAWFVEDGDAGVHAACRRLLMQLEEADWLASGDELNLPRQPIPGREWYVDAIEQTMVILPPTDEDGFLMGSPLSEPGREMGLSTIENVVEKRHRRVIPRRIALASVETKVGDFLQFRPDHLFADQVSPTHEHPINYVTWYQAAQYCNWLSEQNNIPEDQYCYLFSEERHFLTGELHSIVTIPLNQLQRTGYRLLTESEWEYACRAGTTTSRYFGQSTGLLDSHAWHSGNVTDGTTHVVATLRPNRFGLFDLYGNVAEWCQDRYVAFSDRSVEIPTVDSGLFVGVVQQTDLRIIRGGGFKYNASDMRSAFRDGTRPSNANYPLGLRVGRTLPSAP